MKKDMETNEQSPLWKMLVRGEAEMRAPSAFAVKGRGQGEELASERRDREGKMC